MIDKIGDDKCFIGAYAYHVAVRNKINELVDAVNTRINFPNTLDGMVKNIQELKQRLDKIESHKHNSFTGTPVEQSETSEPICDLQNAKCKTEYEHEIDKAYKGCCEDTTNAHKQYIKDLHAVINEVYNICKEYICTECNPENCATCCHDYKIASKLRPYIEEK